MLGSASSAAETSDSLGMNAMTSSGEASRPVPVALGAERGDVRADGLDVLLHELARAVRHRRPLAVAGIWLASR